MTINDDRSEFNTQIVALAVRITDLQALNDDEKLMLLARIAQLVQSHFDDMQTALSDAFLALGVTIGRATHKIDVSDAMSQTFKTDETDKTS